MQLIRDIGELSQPLQASVITVGNFDGVHLGHQKLLRRVMERALQAGVSSGVLTFDPPSDLRSRTGPFPEDPHAPSGKGRTD